MRQSFVSEAPGRICFFGEHQDYLGFPVIACSIPLYCRIHVNRNSKETETGISSLRILTLHVPQLNEIREYNLDALPSRQSSSTSPTDRDFALAAIHEALADGWELLTVGATATFTSQTDFPMQAGLSSSSAFCVAFCQALAYMSGKRTLSPLEIAKLAHRAEVTHFDAPGGTMDHLSSAVGGVLRIGPAPWDIYPLPWPSSSSSSHGEDRCRGVWVLAYSGEPKDTMKHLHRCKNARLALLDKLCGTWDVDSPALSALTLDEQQHLAATIENRDLESSALALWEADDCCSNGPAIAALMLQHHTVLRDGLHLSTPRLEAMNHEAQNAGAWGFKVVGSGGGGCAVAWTSEETVTAVKNALTTAGATETWIIREPAAGARIYDICNGGVVE